MSDQAMTGVILFLALALIAAASWIYWTVRSDTGYFARYERELEEKNTEIQIIGNELKERQKQSLIVPGGDPTAGGYVYAFQITRPKKNPWDSITKNEFYEVVGYTMDEAIADSYVGNFDESSNMYKVERVHVYRLASGEYAIFQPFTAYHSLDKRKSSGYARRLLNDEHDV